MLTVVKPYHKQLSISRGLPPARIHYGAGLATPPPESSPQATRILSSTDPPLPNQLIQPPFIPAPPSKPSSAASSETPSAEGALSTWGFGRKNSLERGLDFLTRRASETATPALNQFKTYYQQTLLNADLSNPEVIQAFYQQLDALSPHFPKHFSPLFEGLKAQFAISRDDGTIDNSEKSYNLIRLLSQIPHVPELTGLNEDNILEASSEMSWQQLNDLSDFCTGLQSLPQATLYSEKARALRRFFSGCGKNTDGSCALIAITQANMLIQAQPFHHVPKTINKMQACSLMIERVLEPWIEYPYLITLHPILPSAYELPAEHPTSEEQVLAYFKGFCQQQDLCPTSLKTMETFQALKAHLATKPDGTICYNLSQPKTDGNGHAVCIVKLGNDILVINNNTSGTFVQSLDDYDRTQKLTNLKDANASDGLIFYTTVDFNDRIHPALRPTP